MKVKPTNGFQSKPPCAIKGCKNDAMVNYAGKWVCGDCAMKKDKELKRRVWCKE